jgi:hypothetical protein
MMNKLFIMVFIISFLFSCTPSKQNTRTEEDTDDAVTAVSVKDLFNFDSYRNPEVLSENFGEPDIWSTGETDFYFMGGTIVAQHHLVYGKEPCSNVFNYYETDSGKINLKDFTIRMERFT